MRSDFQDLTGKVFGRYTVLQSCNRKSGKDYYWLVSCECGNKKEVLGISLKTGRTKSCGCLHKEAVSKLHKTINDQELKHCPRCDEWKTLDSFNKYRGRRDGLSGTCRTCHAEILREYRKQHPEKTGDWARMNPERAQENTKRYRKEHPEWWAEWNKTYYGKPLNRIRARISAMMRHSLKNGKNGKSWESMVGYTLRELREHLSKTMPHGYTWGDLDKLHIDHIIPVSAFNIEDENCLDFKRCWNLDNLRFLPAIENIRKSAKLDKPFQPSLAISDGWL